ncbi:MAG: JAB domain-containing protein [Caldilineaceae bacterium]
MSRKERANPYQLSLNLTEHKNQARYTINPAEWTEQDGLSRFTYAIQEEIRILSPADAATYLLQSVYAPFEAMDQEELWVLLLNHKQHMTHTTMVYRGNINSVVLRPAELFKEAVRFNAPSIILSHCHPSGDPTPSPEDVQITATLVEAGRLLHIRILDHIIVGDNCWISLHETGATQFGS